jgi:hypothetical protein
MATILFAGDDRANRSFPTPKRGRAANSGVLPAKLDRDCHRVMIAAKPVSIKQRLTAM